MRLSKVLVSVGLLILLVGCKKEPVEIQLSTPTNVSFDGVLNWDEVEHATSYDLYIDDQIKTVNNTIYAFDEEGEHTVYIIAKAPDYLDSEPSESINITVEYSISETMHFQYSTHSTLDAIIWDDTLSITGISIEDLNHDNIATSTVLTEIDNQLYIKSSYLVQQEIGFHTFYLIHDNERTLVEINITNNTNPYIISSSNITTSGAVDESFQFELFEGTIYSLNGSKDDVELYSINNNILTVEKEYIAEKFSRNVEFVLSYVLNKDDNSVVGYIFFHLEE